MGDRDEKILPDKDPCYSKVRSLQDLAPHRLDEIAEFFELTKFGEEGQKFAAGRMLIKSCLSGTVQSR